MSCCQNPKIVWVENITRYCTTYGVYKCMNCNDYTYGKKNDKKNETN